MENDTTPGAPEAAADKPDASRTNGNGHHPSKTSPLHDADVPVDAASEAEENAVAAPEPPRRSFDDMNLQPELREALAEMGYERPMEVQTAVYESVVAGRDVMVQSRTGSGKTSAFGIPIVQLLDPSIDGAQVLILAPTRELALQVGRELEQLVKYKGLRVVPVYGGAPMKPQVDALQGGAQIVAGTPGRVLDHIGRGTFKTDQIRFLVLDECDEMLSMGFQEEIEKILQTLPEKRQSLLFSATIPDGIQRIARRYMDDPVDISLSEGYISVEEIDHHYYVVSGMARTRDLLKVLQAEQPESAIIFCNTREDTSTVAKFLCRNGYDAEAISSDLTQNDRERVMKRMRDGNLHFLVATDVAARGIDISNLSHVINYTFPESPEVYVHRSGRTGRAGKSGVAISLIGPREIGAFYYLKLIYKIRPEERDLPSNEELAARRAGQLYEKVVEKVTGQPREEYKALARRLWQSTEGERVVAKLLEQLLEQRPAPAPAPAPAPQVQEAREGEEPARADDERRDARERDGRRDRGRRGEGRDRRDRDDRRPRGRGRDDERRSRGRDRDDDGRRRRRDRDEERRPLSARDERPAEERGAAPEEIERDAREPRDERAVEPREVEARDEREVEAREPREAKTREPREAKTREPREAEARGEREAEARGEREAEARGEREFEARDEREVEARDERDRDEDDDRSGRRRRRRRRRGGGEERSEGGTSSAAPTTSGEPKEFWETWAEEKSTRRVAEPDDEPDAEPEVAAEDADEGPRRTRRRRRERDPASHRARGGRDRDEPARARDTDAHDRDDDRDDDEEAEGRGSRTTVRLYVNLGKREEITSDEVRAILKEGLDEAEAERIGSVALRNTHCYVRVPVDIADKVIESASGKTYKDREVQVERARR